MANRNRTAGNTYEIAIARRYEKFGYNLGGAYVPFFPKLGTTRELSRAMDAAKIDITTVNPREYDKFGLTIQAKNKTTAPSYSKLLEEMKPGVELYGGIPVIYHKQTQRVQKTADSKPRFMTRGEYVILNAPDFERIYVELQTYKTAYEEVLKYFDSFDENVQVALNEFMLELDL